MDALPDRWRRLRRSPYLPCEARNKAIIEEIRLGGSGKHDVQLGRFFLIMQPQRTNLRCEHEVSIG
jgi:hypothetical protein